MEVWTTSISEPRKLKILTYLGLGVILVLSEPNKNNMKTTLYFPQLRPDNYFNIGNIIYISTLTGIRIFKITEKKDLIFYCVDEQDFSRHTFTYTSHQILSDQEFDYIKNLIDQVQSELGSEECTPENIYKSLMKKAKDGISEFILLFHRLDVMFVKQHIKVKYSLNFIGQIMLFESSTTQQKTSNDPKDTIPMPIDLRVVLREYLRSKNMSLSSYFSHEHLDKTSFNRAKKYMDDLIEVSNKHIY
jgi:hypothetical protein